MVNLTLRICASGELGFQTLRGLKLLVGPTSVATDCISCRLFQEVGNSASLLLYQEWKSEEALRGYIRSDEFRLLLGLMETASEKPELRFHSLSGSRGLDLVREVRSEARRVPRV